MSSKISPGFADFKAGFKDDLPGTYRVRIHIILLMAAHFVLAAARITVAIHTPVNNYLLQSQAAREAASMAWSLVFMAYFGWFGHYHQPGDNAGPPVHFGVRLAGLGIFLILFVFLLLGNPLSVLLYNSGKVASIGPIPISPRCLFIASIAVYVYSAVTGVFLILCWFRWRSRVNMICK
ncbi:hypothetical protein IWQ56_004699 [Coemansia nantahalensis]|uniref:Uncharacterized protein n=2 Tax=Coemansia TaxID=4863 RepID=A0ACC1L9X0_9FUNG|nr:hypothetical protein IWQ56_004699 [Coemansia nantahalensis]KAJ2773389.1 hypothetical protein IWQ57_001318 [Coemansia nantahalensis]KAJ2804353.1 hypothetical protein H4R21_001675 [Coemansia helicoidea]